MNGAMSRINNQTPPPEPTVTYNVAKDGHPTGPFDVATLTEWPQVENLSRIAWFGNRVCLLGQERIPLMNSKEFFHHQLHS